MRLYEGNYETPEKNDKDLWAGFMSPVDKMDSFPNGRKVVCPHTH